MENTKNPVNPKKGELKTVRIFVSSTFRDMHAERDYLNRIVFPELRSRCSKRGIEFVGIDLRWGVTEEESRQRKAMDVCLDEIKKCNFFISLLGDRYGWIPVPDEILKDLFESARYKNNINPEYAGLLDEWYQLDQTSKLPVYRLKDMFLFIWDEIPNKDITKLIQFLANKFHIDWIKKSTIEKIDDNNSFRIVNGNNSIFFNLNDEKTKIYLQLDDGRTDQFFSKEENGRLNVYSSDVPNEITEKLISFWQEAGLEHACDSITAREIYLAQAEKFNNKIFFYLRMSGVHEDSNFPQDMVPIFIEQDPIKQNKLSLLKQHILTQKNKKYTVNYDGLQIDPSYRPSNLNDKEKEAFNDGVIQPDEWSSLGDKVREIIRSKGTVALTGMEELGNLILKDLWDAIEKEIEQSSEPLDAHSQERAYHDRFINERTKLFFGRTELLKNMLGYLSNKEERKPLVVTGLPGCGKSALMAKYALQCREEFPDALVVPHFIGASPGSTDLLSTIRSLCETLRLECKLEDEVSSDPDKLRGQLHSFLEKAGSVRSIIIMLDAVNQLDPAYRSHELTWIPFSLPPNVRLIVSTLAGDCLERLQNRVPQENILQVPVLPEIDRKSLIKEHLARRGKKLSDKQITCLLDTKKRQEAGLPLYLLVALEELCLFGNYEELNHEIDKLPPTLKELFDKVIGRLESEHIADRTEFILSLMAVSRYGLLESEILDLLKKYDIKIPRIYWTRFYRSLEFYLRPVDETTGSGLINFYHDQVRFAVYRRYLDMISPDAAKTDKYRHFHSQLADYFHSIAYKNEPAKWSTENPRSLIELPYHLHESGRDEELRKMLFNFGWIHAKLEAVDVNSLIMDYDYISDDRTLQLVHGALRLSAHILTDKGLLPSQLTGRLLSFQEPEIRSLLDGIHECIDGIWLRPLTASLTSPGGPLIRTLKGHTSWVKVVSVTPDGRHAISASSDHTLKVWDLETGIEIRTLKGHTDEVKAVSLTPDGKRAISGSTDSTLKVWDIETGVDIRTINLDYPYSVMAISVTPDGRRAISGSTDYTLKVWDMESGIEIEH